MYCDAGTDAVTLAEYGAKYAAAWPASGMSALHEKSYTVFRADPMKRELTVEFIGAGGQARLRRVSRRPS